MTEEEDQRLVMKEIKNLWSVKIPMNEMWSALTYFEFDDDRIIEFLEKCEFDLDQESPDLTNVELLCSITGAVGYSSDCIGDLLYDFRVLRNALYDLSRGEKRALLKNHTEAISKAEKINVYHQAPGEPTLVGLIFEDGSYYSIAIDLDGDDVYTTEIIQPHWC